MNKKIVIGGLIGLVAVGALYYYYEDVSNMMGYTKEKVEIMKHSAKKIKTKPVKINIENLNEL